MPLTPELRRAMDRIRDHLYGGGYPDPIQAAEQICFLMYFYLQEAWDQGVANASEQSGEDGYTTIFDGEWHLRNPLNATSSSKLVVPRSNLRWSVWATALQGERLVSWLRDEVFPFYADIAKQGAVNFMDGARLSIDEPSVLSQLVASVNELRLESLDSDAKGDLFEYVMRQVRSAGELGQFRTPRHIIRAIVQMVNPKIGETICDPASGTAGFLVGAYDHIRLTNSTQNGIQEIEVDGKVVQRGLGDQLGLEEMNLLRSKTFFGNDVAPQMVRLASMNLTLRGLNQVRIVRHDSLTKPLDPQTRAEFGFPAPGFDVMLANPPFSAKVDRARIAEEVRVGNTKQSELLFLQHILNQLRDMGRCGVVVPDGVLSTKSRAHDEMRRKLVESNTLEAILSLPAGAFNPYSGVKTSVILFRKSGVTDHVMFLHADNDGFRLDAQHDRPIEEDDLPGVVEAFRTRAERLDEWRNRDENQAWDKNWWFISRDEIVRNNYDLLPILYRPLLDHTAAVGDPTVIVNSLMVAEKQLSKDVSAFIESLREVLER